MQADLIGDMTIGLTSGIEPAFQPSSWQNVEVMSATIRLVFFFNKIPTGCQQNANQRDKHHDS